MTVASGAHQLTVQAGATLRVTTCMAPNADPIAQAVVGYLAESLAATHGDVPKVVLDLGLEWPARYAALDAGKVQVAWICGGPFVRRRDQGAGLDLLAAPVWRAERYQNRPIYFSEMVVRAEAAATTLQALRGSHVAINEPGSYSGYEALRAELAMLGETGGFFGAATVTGSHQNSLAAVLDGRADTAAIDSTVLDEELRRRPNLASRLRSVHTLGPAPMPPWVAAAQLDADMRARIRTLLLTMHTTPAGRRALEGTPVAHFAPVSDRAYDPLRARLAAASAVRLVADELRAA